MRKYKIEISIHSACNIVETTIITSENYQKALNIAENMGIKHFKKGFSTWYRAIQI